MAEAVYEDIFLSTLSEIEEALNRKMYIAALYIAVTLPDVCGQVEYQRGNEKTKYMKWYEKYVEPNYQLSSPYGDDMPYMNSEVMYYLRNNLLHNGTPNTIKEKIHNIRFRIDHFYLVVGNLHRGQFSHVSFDKQYRIKDRSLTINIESLCTTLVKAARDYYTTHKDAFCFSYCFQEEVIP